MKHQIPITCFLQYFSCCPSFANLYDAFLTKWPEMSWVCWKIWKMASSGRAENQNIKTTAISAILICSSATRGHFSNLNKLLTSLVTWSKSIIQIFEKILGETCKGGLLFHAKKQHSSEVTLRVLVRYDNTEKSTPPTMSEGGLIFYGFSIIPSRFP